MEAETVLRQFLNALVRHGAEFCRPGIGGAGEMRPPEEFPEPHPGISGFDEDVPGKASRFFAESGGSRPYYPPEAHPHHVEIIFPAQGAPEFLINDRWTKLDDGRVRVLLRNTRHTERCCGGESYALYWLTSMPDLLTLHRTGFSAAVGYRQSACHVAFSPPEAKELWNAFSSDKIDEAHCFALLTASLDFAVRNHLTASSQEEYRRTLLDKVHSLLTGDCSRPLQLQDLAKMAGCSAAHLNRLFIQRYGVPIYRHLLDCRLKEAIRLLSAGASPGEAAARTGFGDPRYFSRFFKERTGVTPTEYRGKKTQ